MIDILISIIDFLPDEAVLALYSVSRTFKVNCRRSLGMRSFARFGKRLFTPSSYIRIATLNGDIMRGSERYLKLDMAVLRAAIMGRRDLISYFKALPSCGRRFPTMELEMFGAVIGNEMELFADVVKEAIEKDYVFDGRMVSSLNEISYLANSFIIPSIPSTACFEPPAIIRRGIKRRAPGFWNESQFHSYLDNNFGIVSEYVKQASKKRLTSGIQVIYA